MPAVFLFVFLKNRGILILGGSEGLWQLLADDRVHKAPKVHKIIKTYEVAI